MRYPIAPRTFRVYCRQLCRKQTGMWEVKNGILGEWSATPKLTAQPATASCVGGLSRKLSENRGPLATISCIHLAPTFVPSRPSTLLRFSLAFLLLSIAQYLPSSVRHSFSATHFPGHCFRLIPASGSFASSAFPVPPETPWIPPIKQPLALEAAALASGCPRKMGQEKGDSKNVLPVC
jgi:hypothetical protein